MKRDIGCIRRHASERRGGAQSIAVYHPGTGARFDLSFGNGRRIHVNYLFSRLFTYNGHTSLCTDAYEATFRLEPVQEQTLEILKIW